MVREHRSMSDPVIASPELQSFKLLARAKIAGQAAMTGALRLIAASLGWQR